MGYLIIILETIFIITEIFILCFSRPRKTSARYTILLVRDSEDFIEGIVRSLSKAIQSKTNPHLNHKLLIIDLGSVDNTLSILEKLSKTKNCVEILYLPILSNTK